MIDMQFELEYIFDFFRNELNVLPTTWQKNYIRHLHEHGDVTYYKKERQIGETYIAMAYLLWLFHMAESAGERITIAMALPYFNMFINVRDQIININSNSAHPLNMKKTITEGYFFGNGKLVYFDQRAARGINIDYVYGYNLKGIREYARVGKVMNVVEYSLKG